VKCPTCSRPILWNADFPQRPFCSDRCRLIDLGAWLNGERSIAGDPADESQLPPDAIGGDAQRDDGGRRG
jgi:endogenous inhibitor of DNA gyrase (YacG/DUF329 family)